jgi:hypothetical protein
MSIANTGYKRLTQNDETIPHRFTRVGHTTLIPIDNELVRKLHITDDDWAYRYETEDGIHIILSKNKISRPEVIQQPDDQDYGK